jgi:hypothetical protein
MKHIRKIIRESLNTFIGENIGQSNYNKYTVGDTIVSDGEEPYTGDNIFPIKGKSYKLIQKNLSEFPYSRQDLYDNDKGYEREQDEWLDKMKSNFDKLPPIPEEGDGLHRIVAAIELGYKTILMWKEL